MKFVTEKLCEADAFVSVCLPCELNMHTSDSFQTE